MSRIICVVPARGGSKRIPGKNKKSLGGKPLVQWVLEAACSSTSIETICLSSDDEGILEVADSVPAVVKIKRPEILASDDAESVDVVLHAFDSMPHNSSYDCVILVQPTSPLITSCDIESAIKLWEKSGRKSVVSVCRVDHPPVWCNILPPDYSMDGFIDRRWRGFRSQDLPEYYRLNGALYISNPDDLRSKRSFLWEHGTFAYVMPRDRSVDIDTYEDFEYAEFLLERKNRSIGKS